MRCRDISKSLKEFLKTCPLAPTWETSRNTRTFQILAQNPWAKPNGDASIVNLRLGSISLEGMALMPKRDQATDDWIPAYFLPWTSNAITFFVLPAKPRAKHFFTSALTGCSVFLCPQPDGRMAVFHAGTSSWGGTQQGNISYRGNNETIKALSRLGADTRPHFWKMLFLEAIQSMNLERMPLIEVTAYDYTEKGGIYRWQDEASVKKTERRLFRNKAIMQYCGCVCGEWDSTSGWVTYLQTKAVSEVVKGQSFRITPTTVRTLWPKADVHNVNPNRLVSDELLIYRRPRRH